MATFVWQLQGTAPTTIDATDKLQFANGVFDGKITVGEYNDSTHVKSNIGNDDSAANTPNNVKFISQGGGGGGDSQADWGDGTEDLDQILDGECTLKITFSDTGVITEDAIFYAYDGAVVANPPAGVTFVAAEKSDTNWTAAEGNGGALAIDDDGAADNHYYYIACSASPDSVGTKSFKVRMELTYS
jgi:hypothetical protein